MKLRFNISAFLRNLQDLPIVSSSIATQLAIMMHYCLMEEKISQNAVVLHFETDLRRTLNDDWTSKKWHGTWQTEKKMMASFKKGDLEAFNRAARSMSDDQVGDISNGDPLRQVKNSGIVFATLLSRAAIEAGMSPEGSYGLSDYYIQRIEASRFISDAYQIMDEMKTVYFQRVRQVLHGWKYSSAVRFAIEYIATHISERISLNSLAKEAGYTAYYLSSKFRNETGESPLRLG